MARERRVYGSVEARISFTCPVTCEEVEHLDPSFEGYTVEEEIQYGDVTGHYIYIHCASCGQEHHVYI
jgi:hypothetical protein